MAFTGVLVSFFKCALEIIKVIFVLGQNEVDAVDELLPFRGPCRIKWTHRWGIFAHREGSTGFYNRGTYVTSSRIWLSMRNLIFAPPVRPVLLYRSDKQSLGTDGWNISTVEHRFLWNILRKWEETLIWNRDNLRVINIHSSNVHCLNHLGSLGHVMCIPIDWLPFHT